MRVQFRMSIDKLLRGDCLRATERAPFVSAAINSTKFNITNFSPLQCPDQNESDRFARPR